ncbi:hypothetical protein [Helicobacter sp.]|uniref:hypothetical protein n=1 Tax=Helicobacter sp. TaxID=218 RepID=UPI0025C6F3B0|nr:hypothetical protein [Helicobacter sp.]MBR2494811.1 hypothetical protein [Helicobacter sp.]
MQEPSTTAKSRLGVGQQSNAGPKLDSSSQAQNPSYHKTNPYPNSTCTTNELPNTLKISSKTP